MVFRLSLLFFGAFWLSLPYSCVVLFLEFKCFWCSLDLSLVFFAGHLMVEFVVL